MSSLYVVCPQCLTWVEPHSERCTECGVTVDVDAPDLDSELLTLRLGEPIMELGPIRLERSGWPQLGQLLATTEGLLFLPDFLPRPNGAIEPRADESKPSESWASGLSQSWWFLRAQTTYTGSATAQNAVSTTSTHVVSSVPAFQRLFAAPGGMFVARTSVRRLFARWNQLKIERPPSRSVVLRSAPGGANVGELERQLRGLKF